MIAHAAKEERLDRYSEAILDAVKSAFVRIAVVITDPILLLSLLSEQVPRHLLLRLCVQFFF